MDNATSINDHMHATMMLAMSPPAIVRPYIDMDGGFSSLLNKITGQWLQGNAEFQKWLRDGKTSRKHLAAVFHEHRPEISRDTISALRHFASVIEKKADESARDRNHKAKKMRKMAADVETYVGKASGEQLRDVLEKSLDQWVSEIEEMLEMAMFMRALAGQYDPDQTIVARARSPEEVGLALAGMVAS